MPIPLITVVLGGAAAVASALGIKKGGDGVSDIKKAKRIAEDAHRLGKAAVSSLERKSAEVNRQLVMRRARREFNLSRNIACPGSSLTTCAGTGWI